TPRGAVEGGGDTADGVALGGVGPVPAELDVVGAELARVGAAAFVAGRRDPFHDDARRGRGTGCSVQSDAPQLAVAAPEGLEPAREARARSAQGRSEEHTSELQSREK